MKEQPTVTERAYVECVRLLNDMDLVIKDIENYLSDVKSSQDRIKNILRNGDLVGKEKK